MSVELDPPELGFKRPFTNEVSQTLRLQNPNSDPMAFKVKTTAPKQYCVRPNSGRIEPSASVEVQVLLQAMKEDPAPDARCRDKFLVQSVLVKPELEAGTVTQIWANVEANAKGSVQEKKIRVVFLPADGESAPPGGALAGGERDADDQPPAYSSPSPASAAATPRKTSEKDEGNTSMASAATGAVGGAAAAVSSAVPTSQEELRQQLEEAKATIARLRSQAEEGLRQRKPVGGSEKSGASGSRAMGMQNAPAPGGVPIPVVAGLCLLCFLLAYLFF